MKRDTGKYFKAVMNYVLHIELTQIIQGVGKLKHNKLAR